MTGVRKEDAAERFSTTPVLRSWPGQRGLDEPKGLMAADPRLSKSASQMPEPLALTFLAAKSSPLKASLLLSHPISLTSALPVKLLQEPLHCVAGSQHGV